MQSHDIEFDESGKPYVNVTLRSYQLLQNPKLNKGSAFTKEERLALGLSGRLPNCVETLEQQIKRSYAQFSEKHTNLQKNIYLNSLHDNNEVR